MSYPLSKKINELLPLVAEKYGVEIEIEAEKHYCQYIYEEGLGEDIEIQPSSELEGSDYEPICPVIEAPQIKQILIALKEVLGETNQDFRNVQKIIEKGFEIEARLETRANLKSVIEYLLMVAKPPQGKADFLCLRWLDGLNPLNDTNPDQVLTELVEVLKNLLK